MAHLYAFRVRNFVKLGVTESLFRRLADLQVATPFRLEFCTLHGAAKRECFHWESWLKSGLAERRVHGEWFTISHAEWIDIQKGASITRAAEVLALDPPDMLGAFVDVDLEALNSFVDFSSERPLRLALGVNSCGFRHILEGNHRPSLEQVEAFASLVGVNAQTLLTGT